MSVTGPSRAGSEDAGARLECRGANPPARSGYRRLAGNTAATLAGRAAAVVLALVLSTILFRALGPQRFGLWSLFAYLVGYSTLVDFGLAAAVERQVARLKAEGRASEIPGTIGQAVLLVVVAMAAVSLLVLAVTAVFEARSGRPVPLDILRGLRVLPGALALITGSLVIGSGLSGLQRMASLYAWRTAGMAIGTAAVCLLALFGVQRLDVLLLAYAAGAPVAGAGQWWRLTRELPAASWSVAGGHGLDWHRASIRQLLGFGGVLQLATIGPMLGEYIFRIVVSRRFGLEYAGIYDLAARAALGLRSLASSLFVAMVPFGVGVLSGADRTRATSLVRLAVKYTGLFMLPSSVLLVIVAGPVVHWWLGPGAGAEQVAVALRPLVLLHALVSLTVPMAMMGRSAGQPGPECVTAWAGVTAGVAVSLVAPGFPPAVVLFGAMPLAAGVALWVLLAGRLGVPFEGWRDLLATGVVTVSSGAAALVARYAAMAAYLSPVSVVAAAALAWAVVGVGVTATLGLIGSAERGVLTSIGRR